MDLSIYSGWGAGAAFVTAWLTAFVLMKWHGAPADSGRFSSIDGLRGFLAFSVYLHHSVIWFVFLRTGQWVTPQSSLFRHFGDSAVALFFMITAFLFTTKVLNSRQAGMDWTRLYVGRWMRLFPMYAVAVALMWVLAWQLTGWTRHVPLSQLFKQMVVWALFTIRGPAGVNNWDGANLLMAGVTWSLPYEWWFYLSLPLLAWVSRRKVLAGWLAFGLLNVLLFKAGWHLERLRMLPFVGGWIAAWAVRSDVVRVLATRRWAGVLVLGCLAATVAFTETAYTATAVALLSIAFVLVAAGNDVFGVLSSAASRMLGEVTYSMYLLHGLMLAFTFQLLVGMNEASAWSPLQHWLLILGLTAPLVCASYAGYRWIEMPGQRLTPRVHRRVCGIWSGKRPAST